ncbi:MAG TPA: hypothetical protein PK453_16310 [Leptospiraceae bacterium]|nr:hypothetical protein [Leptospiraceae bacterium]HMY67070.1 hypothetical protein [Leptospiraceae bacterium]HNF15233.1 hypothetical protein [Leptospiraceae bacterium]HNF26212.1 hypothetical protein [Leptospiraceae bacterium]HNH07564.1 hypothetical protein [Leptospiraceae bacterium]
MNENISRYLEGRSEQDVFYVPFSNYFQTNIVLLAVNLTAIHTFDSIP